MKTANELLLAGNVFLRDAFFREAAAKYREAIAIWDHPAFHFNLPMAQRALDQRCGDGCGDAQVPAVWVEELRQAETEQHIARAAYITGGAVLATGAVLVYLNRERVVRVSAGDAADGANVTVSPMLSPRGAGLTAALRF